MVRGTGGTAVGQRERVTALAWLAFSAVALQANQAAAQDIIVTGSRDALLAGIAASAAQLGGEDIARIDPQVPSEALNRLPGLAIQRNNGVENLIAIRSPVLTGGQSAGSFLVLDNGVPIRAPGFANVNQLWETSLDFADAVTVVRGPGSSLYGSNAVHGLVNVETLSGIPDRSNCTRQEASFSVDALGRSEARAIVRRGMRQGMRGSQATHCQTPDNNTPDAVDGEWGTPWRGTAGLALDHDRGWRAQSGLDRQALMVAVGHGNPNGGWEFEGRLLAQNLNQESAGFLEGPRAYDNATFARTNAAPEAYRDTQLVRGQLAITGRFGRWEVNVTPFARVIETDLNLFFFPSGAQELTRQAGGGVLVSAAFELTPRVGVLVGLDADRTRGEVREVQARATTGTYTQGLHYDYAVDMQAAGLYAQADWAITQDWRLTAGLRGERVSYDYDNRAPTGDVGRFRRPVDREDVFEGLAPRLALSRSVGTGTLWLNAARGERPPQITDLYSLQTRQNAGEQGVEKLDSVELGWRQNFDGGSIEVVAYTMDKRDTSFRGADGLTVNGGRTHHEGLELSGTLQVLPTLSVAGWVAYSQQTYRFNSPADGIREGAAIDTAPEWLSNVRLNWQPTDRADMELEWAHVGPSFTDAANTRVYKGHDVLTLRGSIDVSNRTALFAAIRNLTNTGYADRADFAFGRDRYFPGAPRSLTVGLRYRN